MMEHYEWPLYTENWPKFKLEYYSVDTAYTCYSKLNWWQKLFRVKRKFLGYDYHIEIRTDIHDYLNTDDVINILGENWRVAFFGGSNIYVVQNLQPIMNRKPLSIGATIVKLYSLRKT